MNNIVYYYNILNLNLEYSKSNKKLTEKILLNSKISNVLK